MTRFSGILSGPHRTRLRGGGQGLPHHPHQAGDDVNRAPPASGSNVWAAIQIAKRPENKGQMIVIVACSTGERYLSTPLAAEARAKVGG